MKRLDLTGQKFGKLTVISYAFVKNQKTYWRCKCECGNKIETCGNNLKTGHIKSCGCIKKTNIKPLQKWFKAISPTGKVYISNNITKFAERLRCDKSYLARCIRENRHCNGWMFVKIV